MNAPVQQAGPRVRLGAILSVACLLLLAACNHGVGDNRAPEPGDTAVAKVNDETIWASDVKREAVAQGLIGEGEPLDISTDLFHRVLDEVIDQKLLSAEALKRRVENEPLAKRRLAAARERILGDLLVQSVVDQGVNDNAIKSLYEEQLKLAKPSPQYHLRMILSASEADANATRKLLATGAAFDALAMNRSTDATSRFNGGDLDYQSLDEMPDAYAQAVKTAQVGQVVGPFKTDAGWVLLKVEDQRPEKAITLDEARPQIVRFLTYDQVRELLDKLHGQSKVKVLIGPAQVGPDTLHEPASAPAGALAPPSSGAPPSPGAPLAPGAPAGPSTAEKMMQPPAPAAPPAALAPKALASKALASKLEKKKP
jgi:peptidyl-prolyl cis-trans isomerase C